MRKHDGLIRIVILVLLFGILPKLSSAQDSGLRPVSSKYAIKNATIVQAPGKTIQNGTIIIENGIIKAVGSNISIPVDAWIVDADSMFVYPGFISGMSNIGVAEPKAEDTNDDRKMTGTPTYKRAGITPGSSVRDMLSTKEKVADYRKIGFTASHSVPHNGMIAGQGSLVLLGGSTSEGMLVKENISMFSQLSGASGVYPNTVIGVMAKYRDLYRKANEAKDYQSRYKSNSNGMERPVSDATIEAMFPVVSKQMTVAFRAESIMDIMRVLTLKNDLGFNLMLGEVKQGWDAIPSIKNAGSSVFLSLDLPEMKEEDKKEEEAESEEKEESIEDKEKAALEMRQKEMIKKYYTQASLFASQGVKFGFSTLESKSKDFKSTMIKVIENGLSEDQALAALTTTPAEILGVSSTMGTIENGKMANLFVSDTAYFTKDSNVRFVFVDGVKYEYAVKKKKKKKSSGEEAVDASGSWNYSTETPQGKGKGVIKIEGNPGDYTGTISVSFNGSTNDIQNMVVDGNNVTFSFTINMGEEVTVDISMDIDGDSFEGTLSVAAFGSFPMEGSREPK
ncbi:MAG: amidohydrolase family protein [Ekhidna sp.]